MPAGAYDPSLTYIPLVGMLYIFNLIVGTGALALPKAFQTAGWLLSVILLCISCFVSYVSATFVIESLSIANAVNAKRKQDEEDADESSDNPIHPHSFEITQRVEVSEMATMFLSKFGVILSYISLDVYLFGDLAIYSSTVSKSFMSVVCNSMNQTVLDPEMPCRSNWPELITRFAFYRISIILFIAICTPMILAGITKTKYLQLATTLSRWTAFLLMIFLASTQLIEKGPSASPPLANMHSFGKLFGVSVYAFMCHHSLPSLITPMSSKLHAYGKIAVIYGIVLCFYFTLSLTGAFAFERVQDVYTLNFLSDEYTSFFYFTCDHFLALFPVFTLTTNYPIVAITLMNNLKVLRDLFFPPVQSDDEEGLVSEDRSGRESSPVISRSPYRGFVISDALIPLTVIGLPTIISLFSDNVLFLASVTGSYPGVGVQFIIPCLLIIKAREYADKVLGTSVPIRNQSPFSSLLWPYAILGWGAFSIIMTTLNLANVNF